MNRRMDGRRSRMENCYSPLSMNLSYLVLQIRSGKEQNKRIKWNGYYSNVIKLAESLSLRANNLSPNHVFAFPLREKRVVAWKKERN